MLDLWPPLPLVMTSYWNHRYHPLENVDNIIAVLEHRNRVCRIHITNISSTHLEKVLAAMQEPFPQLTALTLSSGEKRVRVLPDSFLGGSVHHLKYFSFHGIPFPGVPKLILSATHLTNLLLTGIPHSGYFSPEAIATALSTLTRLEGLRLEFQSPLSLPDRLPPPKRVVLPVLIEFGFKGVGEYLEDLVLRIDAPLLKESSIIFFNQILFDTPQLVQFISRTSALTVPEKARVIFSNGAATIQLSSRAHHYGDLRVGILCEKSDWQVSSLEQVCTSCLPALSTLEDLYITGNPYWRANWQDNIESTLWLELFQPFTGVKNLYLSEELVPPIMPSLQELVGERTTEVLPTLENIFLEGLETSGPVQKAIQQFVATRQASHPIAVSIWEGKVYEVDD
jgi:hypothetical protein